MATANNIGITNKPFVSAVPLLDAREIWPQIIDLQDDAEWTQMMTEMGNTRVASKIYHYDNFFNNPKFIVIDTTGATVTGSGTTTITVTNLAAGNNNYIIVGNTILLPNGRVALVQTLSTTTLANDTFTATSVTGNVLTLTTGDKISVNGTAMEEASNASSPQRFNLTSIRNNIQIMDQVWEITDVQGGSQREVEIDGQFYIMPQTALDSMQLLRGRISATMWSGEASATLFEDSSPTLTGPQGNAVQTTRGLDSYVSTYGFGSTVLTPGTLTTPDMQDICARATAVKSPKEFMWVMGSDPKTVVDIWAKNLGSSGVQSVRLPGDGGGATNFEVDQFKFGGYTFNLTPLKLLSNPQVFNYAASGSTKLSIARSGYLLPMGKCPVYGGTDGNGGSQNYFQIRYCPPPADFTQGMAPMENNGQIYAFKTGAFAGTNDSAYLKCRYYTAFGTEVFKPQVFGKIVLQ